jgi:uncharacterized protein YbjQ (UPF0145 family)
VPPFGGALAMNSGTPVEVDGRLNQWDNAAIRPPIFQWGVNMHQYESRPTKFSAHKKPSPVMTGLSGNELFCLHQKGLAGGDLVVGNSVYSMGWLGGFASGLKTLVGGEVTQVTTMIQEGRQLAYNRLVDEAQRHGAVGITAVTSELINHGGNIEFLSIGSAVHVEGQPSHEFSFSSSADGQELYCLMDAGFRPIKFVFGNVAYSMGIGGSIMGQLRSMARGEVHEYSNIFTQTRHLALERIVNEAREAGANSVVGIKTTVENFGCQEMVMTGTACYHPDLGDAYLRAPITSDLTNEEMWNLINMGHMPIQLVLSVSVYSLGLAGGIVAAFKGVAKGEISELTSLIYDARSNALRKLENDAAACGADRVVGIKTYVIDLGDGVIEFMAIGTATKAMSSVKTQSPYLIPQAVIKDKKTYIQPPRFGMVQGMGGTEV